jgi:hypothetical protein
MSFLRSTLALSLLAAGSVLSAGRTQPAPRTAQPPNLVGHYDGLATPVDSAARMPFTIDVLKQGQYDVRGNAQISGVIRGLVYTPTGKVKFHGIVASNGYFSGVKKSKQLFVGFAVSPTDQEGTFSGTYSIARGRLFGSEGTIQLVKRS